MSDGIKVVYEFYLHGIVYKILRDKRVVTQGADMKWRPAAKMKVKFITDYYANPIYTNLYVTNDAGTYYYLSDEIKGEI